MTNWVKLNLFYIGKSKKHYIFKAKQWDPKLERLFKKTIFNEKYKNIGYIKDIFGPIDSPFISVQTFSDQEFTLNNKLYAKLN